MTRNRYLNEKELGQIEGYHKSGFTQAEIARLLVRPQKTIHSAISRNFSVRGPSGGRPKVISERDERKIVNLSSSGQYSIREIQREIPNKFSIGTISNTIKSTPFLKWVKRKKQPILTPQHMMKRI